MVISLLKIPYVHRIYMVLANPTQSSQYHNHRAMLSAWVSGLYARGHRFSVLMWKRVSFDSAIKAASKTRSREATAPAPIEGKVHKKHAPSWNLSPPKRQGAPLSAKRKTSLHQKGKVRLSSPKRQGAPLSTKKGEVHLSPPKGKPLSTKKARCASLHQKGKVHLSPPKKARCTSLHQKENLSPPKRQGAPLSTKEGKVHNRTHTHTHTHHSGNFGWKHTQAETH